MSSGSILHDLVIVSAGRPGWPLPFRRLGGPDHRRAGRGGDERPGEDLDRDRELSGLPLGISGSELAGRAVIQAEKFGARINVPAEAIALERRDGRHVVKLDGSSIAARR